MGSSGSTPDVDEQGELYKLQKLKMTEFSSENEEHVEYLKSKSSLIWKEKNEFWFWPFVRKKKMKLFFVKKNGSGKKTLGAFLNGFDDVFDDVTLCWDIWNILVNHESCKYSFEHKDFGESRVNDSREFQMKHTFWKYFGFQSPNPTSDLRCGLLPL